MTSVKRWITERPRVTGAALVVAGLAIALGIVLPRVGGGDDTPDAAQGGPPVLRSVALPPLGLALTHPGDWRREAEGQALRLRSPEGSVTITFAAPEGPGRTAEVRRALESTLREKLRDVEILDRGKGKLGRETVRRTELVGLGRDDERVRALLLAGASTWRTYAVTVVTSERPSKQAVAEAAGILASVETAQPGLGGDGS